MTRWFFWFCIGTVLYLVEFPVRDTLLAFWFLITCIAIPTGIIVWLVSKR